MKHGGETVGLVASSCRDSHERNGLRHAKETVSVVGWKRSRILGACRVLRFRPPSSTVLFAALSMLGLSQFSGLFISFRNQGPVLFGATDYFWISSTSDSARPSLAAANPSVRQKNTTIFFNIYIPDDTNTSAASDDTVTPGELTDWALSIVSEQLQQVAESYAGGYWEGNNSTGNESLPTVHVYYLTVGPTNLLPETRMNNSSDLCGAYPHFYCHHLGHHTSGFEHLTLEHMHEYCRAHLSERVVYLHNKGSFHDIPGLSEKWRRVLTRGAIAQECLEPPDDRCNVCGFMWYTVVTLFVPGNMFAAKCDYVASLLPPLVEYQAKHREAVAEGLLLLARRQLMSNSVREQPQLYGLGRHSAEQWIGTFLDSLLSTCSCLQSELLAVVARIQVAIRT
jgi:hypothetical protein